MSDDLMTNARKDRGHRFVRQQFWDLSKEQIDELFASGLREEDYYEQRPPTTVEEPDEKDPGDTGLYTQM